MKLRFLIIIPAAALFAACSASADTEQSGNQSLATPSCMPADKVIVSNFYGTRRCAGCIAVGNLAQKTIEQEFPMEQRMGTLVFQSINAELPENREEVQKYQARGSSLFINAIRSGEETIEEEVTVWRLAGNEQAYIQYLKGKLSALLTCS